MCQVFPKSYERSINMAAGRKVEKTMIKWVKWNSASRSNWIVTFSFPFSDCHHDGSCVLWKTKMTWSYWWNLQCVNSSHTSADAYRWCFQYDDWAVHRFQFPCECRTRSISSLPSEIRCKISRDRQNRRSMMQSVYFHVRWASFLWLDNNYFVRKDVILRSVYATVALK